GDTVTKSLCRRLNRLVIKDRQRSPSQDILFLVNELVEISARALSTGVNDPFTAITCIDRLGAATKDLLREDLPSPWRYDHEGILRVVAQPISFADFSEAAFGQLRPYATRDSNVTRHLLGVLAQIMSLTRTEAQREVILAHTQLIARSADQNMPTLEDKRAIQGDFRGVLESMAVRRLNHHSSSG
ncbi:MAG: DUF2254 family protein, partial [Bradymonadaceae bacterium]